ncbi:MAG: 4a-hydroxytetrahydrobiopterin dehydratase [Isosphaeraceae bacterium]
MSKPTAEELARKKCAPCEGGVPPVAPEQARAMLSALPGWTLTEDAQRIRRDWVVRNFLAGIDFFKAVAALAEQEGHHPDLHLEGYRNVRVELWTHAIGGLSENDFILAAKIDSIPIALRR